jgi:hypothetical protein
MIQFLVSFGAAHIENIVVRIALTPGLALQAMTTRQPDDRQIEVAISALKRVLAVDAGQPIKLAEEAGPVPGVAHRSHWFGFHQNRIIITIFPDLAHPDEVARGLALVPQLFPAPTVEPYLAAGQGAAQGLPVHIAQHQYLAGIRVLDYGWYQPLSIKLEVSIFILSKMTSPLGPPLLR